MKKQWTAMLAGMWILTVCVWSAPQRIYGAQFANQQVSGKTEEKTVEEEAVKEEAEEETTEKEAAAGIAGKEAEAKKTEQEAAGKAVEREVRRETAEKEAVEKAVEKEVKRETAEKDAVGKTGEKEVKREITEQEAAGKAAEKESEAKKTEQEAAGKAVEKEVKKETEKKEVAEKAAKEKAEQRKAEKIKKKEQRRLARRKKIVKYALQFEGNPYVYGGTSLTNGADCSGFVMSVFAHFGYELPRVAAAQCEASVKKDIEDIEPGDLVFYGDWGVDHVAIYIGNGEIIHASTSATGIRISQYDYRTPAAVGTYLN